MELYRPICAEEYQEIQTMHFRGFPRRTEDQPLFTALLSQEGASQIASRMRVAKQSNPTVYVVSFLVDDAYIRQFPVQHTEERDRRALWIPAEEIDILNQHLIGEIRVLASYEVNRSDGDTFFA